MAVTLRLSGEAASSDELRSLRSFLLTDSEFRGRVKAVERPPEEGVLGPVLESLQLALGSAAGAFGGVVIAWIRSRTGKCTLHVVREDGSEFSLRHDQVRMADVAEIAGLAEQLNRFASGGAALADGDVPATGQDGAGKQ
jgi:Effector Associated Constant Component 1